MKRLSLLFLAIILLNLFIFSQAFAGAQKDSIVGVWEVEVKGAPFAPHLLLFHADGTMLSTNPGNVQLDPADPHGGTHDSLGMGVWKRVTEGDSNVYIGTFCEHNAYADNHQPADTLYVTFKIKIKGDTFSGKALARYGAVVDKVTMIGHHRLKIDYKTAARL